MVIIDKAHATMQRWENLKASVGIVPRLEGDTLPIAAHGRKRARGPETRERERARVVG